VAVVVIKPEGPQHTVVTSESLTLECIAEGAPDARVVWVPPPGSSAREVEGRGSVTLHIDEVTPGDSGIFTCYIYTDVGQQEKTIQITGIYVNNTVGLLRILFADIKSRKKVTALAVWLSGNALVGDQ